MIQLNTKIKRRLADIATPVSLYLKLRDHYTTPVLLESNDFALPEECYSFIGLQSIAEFKVQNGEMQLSYPDGRVETKAVNGVEEVPAQLQTFAAGFKTKDSNGIRALNGLLGHVSFDGVQYFDTLEFAAEKRTQDIPDLRFNLHRFVISINHFNDELVILENLLPGQESEMERLEQLIDMQKISTHSFSLDGVEESNLSDEEFKELVRIGKHHCQIGDVFQIVFSRQFSQKFQGDEFNVYRVLRSINPSPYLFYFDYGDYKIFGSSPEAQMVVRKGIARVNPIAGTYRRSGDAIEDATRAKVLAVDPKENAEHIMLVDLARNDLGRHAVNVEVKKLKEVQFFSHVIHLVSTVTGQLPEGANPVRIFGDTFPAGTLSGAPKYKAIQLINQYENQNRAFYGGALGYIGFDGDINTCIVIRSFLSRNNTLYYQAGAGIVVDSKEENELQEVHNKLGALTKALGEAEKLGKQN
jgi:anthranilate synthase component 1